MVGVVTAASSSSSAEESSSSNAWISAWRKISTMEKNILHPHRNLGLIFLVVSAYLQFRFFVFGLKSGSFLLEELALETKLGRFVAYMYGVMAVALPITGLVVFRDHLQHRNKKFDKEKGNTLDTVLVNLYFQVGNTYVYFRLLPGFWPDFLKTPTIDWSICTFLFAGFDFVLSPRLQRQSLRRDGLFLTAQKNYLIALGMLMNKWCRQLQFAAIILGENDPMLPAYWSLNFAASSLFTFPIYMFFYTLRMKRLVTAETLEGILTVFSIAAFVQGVVTVWPPSLLVANFDVRFKEYAIRGILVLILAGINLRCSKFLQHVAFNSVIVILATMQYYNEQ